MSKKRKSLNPILYYLQSIVRDSTLADHARPGGSSIRQTLSANMPSLTLTLFRFCTTVGTQNSSPTKQ